MPRRLTFPFPAVAEQVDSRISKTPMSIFMQSDYLLLPTGSVAVFQQGAFISKLLWSCALPINSSNPKSKQPRTPYHPPLRTIMSAWIDILKHSHIRFDTHFSWKDYIQTSIKTIAISLVATAISTFVMAILEKRWNSSPQSAGQICIWKLCLAFAGSGMAVTGVDWIFGASDKKSDFAG